MFNRRMYGNSIPQAVCGVASTVIAHIILIYGYVLVIIVTNLVNLPTDVMYDSDCGRFFSFFANFF